jgi:ActD protein
MSDELVAVIDNIEAANEAIARLQASGIPSTGIIAASSEPLHGLEPAEQSPSRISLFGICGGLLGAVFAIALTVSTSKRVGLVTGGMPIVTPWAFGIIVFELTALGAILATLARMIFEARLARSSSVSELDEMTGDGRVVLTIKGSSDTLEAARLILGSSVIASE